MARTIEINCYRAGGEWYGARWIDGEYDGCDALDVEGDADEAAALEAAHRLGASIADQCHTRRVADAPAKTQD